MGNHNIAAPNHKQFYTMPFDGDVGEWHEKENWPLCLLSLHGKKKKKINSALNDNISYVANG